jgi:hypothetical protein
MAHRQNKAFLVHKPTFSVRKVLAVEIMRSVSTLLALCAFCLTTVERRFIPIYYIHKYIYLYTVFAMLAVPLAANHDQEKLIRPIDAQPAAAPTTFIVALLVLK